MAKGLLAAGFNYGMVAEDEFNDWYDTEHIPERSRVPGFINCVRWVGVEDPRVSIATYDLDRREVLYSDAYKAIARDNLSPWSKRVVGRCQRLLRIEADQLVPGNEVMRGTTQNLMVFACNVKPEIEAEVKQWYGEEHIPRLIKVPGVASARFFASQTGTHKFIALYEIDKPETCASEAWKEAAFTPWTGKMRPQLADVLRVVLRRYQRKAA